MNTTMPRGEAARYGCCHLRVISVWFGWLGVCLYGNRGKREFALVIALMFALEAFEHSHEGIGVRWGTRNGRGSEDTWVMIMHG